MNRNTIRIVIVFGVIAIIGIIAIQAYWVRKAFDLKEHQFKQTTMVTLRNVANQIAKSYNLSNIENPVTEISSDYYVVNLRTHLDHNTLEYLLIEELKKNNIFTDFEYGIYDCDTDKIVYGGRINSSKSNYEEVKVKEKVTLPKTDKYINYFAIRFPERASFLVGKIDFWVVSSIITLLVMTFFAYAMFVILKQKRLSEVQRDFINNMTHEFQTPISTIKIATDVLASDKILAQPERFKKYVEIIKHENNRLKNQVESVLATAKIGKGLVELDLKLQEIHELILEVTGSVKAELEENFELHFNATKTSIYADKLHLMNVIRNLIDNAIKYSKGDAHVSITTLNIGNTLIMQIKDRGIGIPKEHVSKIFDRFYRVPTGNIHNVKGFGLGLNYVKKIIKLQKWKIEVQSQENIGTQFDIIIPLPD